jgi:hypothetical protein
VHSHTFLPTNAPQIGRGYRVSNVDVTLICQKPRVNVEHNGHQVKSLMMDNLARLLHVSLGRVNVKARTHENVDSVSALHSWLQGVGGWGKGVSDDGQFGAAAACVTWKGQRESAYA